MGGSILGVRSNIHFFKNKIKKKVYFFDNLDENKIRYLKKKKLSKSSFYHYFKIRKYNRNFIKYFYLKLLKKMQKI